MWPNTPISTLTETSILYTDGYMDGHTDEWTDRQADSSPCVPPKTFILWRYNDDMWLWTKMETLVKWENADHQCFLIYSINAYR